jgi:hypothetical protein
MQHFWSSHRLEGLGVSCQTRDPNGRNRENTHGQPNMCSNQFFNASKRIQKHNTIINTGAKNNLVSKGLLGKERTRQKSLGKADGLRMAQTNILKNKIHINGKKEDWEPVKQLFFTVKNMQQKGILGMPFLTQILRALQLGAKNNEMNEQMKTDREVSTINAECLLKKARATSFKNNHELLVKQSTLLNHTLYNCKIKFISKMIPKSKKLRPLMATEK